MAHGLPPITTMATSTAAGSIGGIVGDRLEKIVRQRRTEAAEDAADAAEQTRRTEIATSADFTAGRLALLDEGALRDQLERRLRLRREEWEQGRLTTQRFEAIVADVFNVFLAATGETVEEPEKRPRRKKPQERRRTRP